MAKSKKNKQPRGESAPDRPDRPAAPPPDAARGPASPQRRSLLVQTAAAVVGLVVGVVPLAVGLFTVLAGLGGKSQASRVRVTSLDAVPRDGTPRAFAIVAEREDAWTRHPESRIGTVFIRDSGDGQLQVFNATCPHLGCLVGFKPARNAFACPCHNSFFQVDGGRINPEHCPSPRDLDQLEYEIVDNDVFVTFQRFRSGIPEKVPE